MHFCNILIQIIILKLAFDQNYLIWSFIGIKFVTQQMLTSKIGIKWLEIMNKIY